jgi:uncharacterized membrane protein YidH (DUF202 family)
MTSAVPAGPPFQPISDGPAVLAAEAAKLTAQVVGVRDDLKAVRGELANEKKWRKRFAWSVTAFAVLAIGFGVTASLLIASNHRTGQHLADTQQHLAAVVACTNTRNSQFVTAVNTRAIISTQQSTALRNLLTQVVHVTSSQQLTDDINAYVTASNALAAHKLPAYPANACT